MTDFHQIWYVGATSYIDKGFRVDFDMKFNMAPFHLIIGL